MCAGPCIEELPGTEGRSSSTELPQSEETQGKSHQTGQVCMCLLFCYGLQLSIVFHAQP